MPEHDVGRIAYKKYLLSLLILIGVSNFLDRMALGIVLQDIKRDLALSDTQLGLLSGIAFAFFYAIVGIPIARWADRGNRITIITITTALWSGMVVLFGFAGNFVQLLLIRVGMGVGEAGCVPPAHSLIADHFSRAERLRATSFYSMREPLALIVGYFVAGWLNQFYGWRITFLVLGAPGLLLAAVAWLTLKEPRRHAASTARQEPPVSVFKVGMVLWSNATFRHLLLCFSVWSFFGFGLLQWQPAFFMRSHGLHSGEVGSWFAIAYGLGGVLGAYYGGVIAFRYAAGKERLQLRAGAIAFCFFALSSTLAYIAPSHYIAFALLGVAMLVGNAVQGPILATIQSLVPGHMRAQAIAFVYLFAHLIGTGLGPLTAGALSDFLQPWAGRESLRYALMILTPGYFWAAWHLWRASKTVIGDLAAAPLEHDRLSPTLNEVSAVSMTGKR